MKLKAVSGMMLTMLLIGMLTLAFNIQPVKAQILSYKVYDDPLIDWKVMDVRTPKGIENGDIIDIFKSGQLIAKFDAGMRFIMFLGSPLVKDWFAFPGGFLGAQYREMYNGPFHRAIQSNPTIEEKEGAYVLSVHSEADDGGIQTDYSFTIYQDGRIYVSKRAVVPSPLATDECSTEDGSVGIHLVDESVDGGAHVEVYDDGELYSWDIESRSGWGNIDASHALEHGDWLSLTKVGSDVKLVFEVDYASGYDNDGNPSPLGAVIQYGPGSFAVFIGRKGVTMWYPTILPAGEYILRGWISLIGKPTPPPTPVGGEATPINIPTNKPETPALWIWLSTILLPLIATAVFVKLKKKKQYILPLMPANSNP